MSLDNQFKIKKIANSFILYDDSVVTEPTLQLFAGVSPDADYHTKSGAQQNNSAAGSIAGSRSGIGRAQVVYFQYESNSLVFSLVLKHYYRGGMIARLSKDRYLGFGVENSRAFKEFRLLKKMSELGLPVPDAVAARVEKQLFSYRADLISREIENVKTLSDILSGQKLDAAFWKKIGSTIKQFHQHDIYHADLNARNILITDSEEIYLIDFDNSYIRTGSASWKMANMARLNRSLMKFKKNTNGFNFDEKSWSLLLDGYS
ncbi:MAG: 3-deoxy-D-manno-octulosonic acid kinase [Gammaproteobacteria bacterium]